VPKRVSQPLAIQLFRAFRKRDVDGLNEGLKRLADELADEPGCLDATPSIRKLVEKVKRLAEDQVESKEGLAASSYAVGPIAAGGAVAIAGILIAVAPAAMFAAAIGTVVAGVFGGSGVVYLGVRLSGGRKQWENVARRADQILAPTPKGRLPGASPGPRISAPKPNEDEPHEPEEQRRRR